MSDLRHTTIVAYQGRDDCMSPLCRRLDVSSWLREEPGCIGWHCAICDEPSSTYGHADCQEEAADV